MSFDTPNGPVFEPENPMLRSFYEMLEELAPMEAGCRKFEKWVEIYEALEFDMREEIENEPAASA
ncbi:hypothetical protein [Siminovitchia terrae]|uniref:hypothetical protein n=1 Tax=Siminovitchia terrae TaxID=1914933 RepID=UPI0028A5C1DE|nr:hypothetical protein [Siminovitchia terrae]